jgi:two-component system, chemotaxis family, chemotaxis protein CheY
MPKRILIVDDLEHLRKMVRDFLEEELGFHVCGEAIDGFDAIEKAKELKPDLIVLDLSMPRMNGIQAAPRLKKILPETPIILFTMHGGLMKGLNAREIGVDAVVAKDRGMSSLGERVQSLFQPL